MNVQSLEKKIAGKKNLKIQNMSGEVKLLQC